jgi:hypothetical protein
VLAETITALRERFSRTGDGRAGAAVQDAARTG